MDRKEDIFDKIMQIRIFAPIQPFYIKHKEVLLYLLFGGLSFVISIATYYLFSEVIQLNELISNIISWIFAVSFAFVTNYIWVFEKTVTSIKEFFGQVLKFFMGRVFTLVVEELILIVFVTILSLPNMPIKVIAQIIVIVLNYVISKLYVFKKIVKC
ncbi:MAG: GtrA family protein [Lachnospiraceae bacterium]|nr:GtrA family protein [Lachnospiraceae bacterium]